MDNSVMDIQEIRRLWLAKLIENDYKSQADFAAQTGINQGELSSLLGGGKSFGEKKARKIEADSGMPDRWLDRSLEGAKESAEVIDLAARRPSQLSEALGLSCETAAELRLISIYRLARANERLAIDNFVERIRARIDADMRDPS